MNSYGVDILSVYSSLTASDYEIKIVDSEPQRRK